MICGSKVKWVGRMAILVTDSEYKQPPAPQPQPAPQEQGVRQASVTTKTASIGHK